MKIKREYSIALIVLLGAGFLTFGIYYLKGIDLFQKPNVYHVVYRDVTGINSSSPVFYRGYKVGQVIRTNLLPATGDIAVSFQLDEDRLKLTRGTKVQIFSADLFSRALQLVMGPDTVLAQVGDTLLGDSQLSLTDAVGEQIDPLKRKAEGMLASIDSVLSSLQLILNDSARRDIDASFSSIRKTLEVLNSTAGRVDQLIATETATISATLKNIERITANLVAVNDDVARIVANMDTATANLAGEEMQRAINDLAVSSAKLKEVMTRMEQGEGTMGQLMKNDTLYRNMESATRELDLLLEDLRMNPNRYVHMSLFGRKDKLPTLSDSDIDRLKEALKEDKRLRP